MERIERANGEWQIYHSLFIIWSEFLMSDIFPEDTLTILGCQAAFVLVPIAIGLIGMGVGIGWLIWG